MEESPSGHVDDQAIVSFIVPAHNEQSCIGATVEAIVLFVDTGNVATDALIAYIDSASSGLPVTPNGGDIVVAWNASGIAAL